MSRNFPGSAGNDISIGEPAAVNITGTALTIHAWIAPDTVSGFDNILSKWTGSNNGGWATFLNNGVFTINIADGVGTDGAGGGGALPTGRWSSVAAVKNGTGAGALSVYLNGVSVDSQTSNRSITALATPLRIGRDSAASPFTGRIAEVSLWAAALTAPQIAQLANYALPLDVQTTGLRGYWPLCGQQSPEPDFAQGNAGTVNGTVPAASHPFVGLCGEPGVRTRIGWPVRKL